MKPGFALDLRQETIRLLHRTRRGWLEIGNADLDAPDLTGELAVLRRTALGLSPNGIATKLILPESQLLFIEVPVRAGTRAALQGEIGQSLEGMTPYSLGELAFDWSGTAQDGMVSVAAVARLTLAEAESFAVSHGFNPVSFVAHPGTSTFVGEPFFGAATHAEKLLAKGDRVERDAEAVEIVKASADERVLRPDLDAAREAAPDEAQRGADRLTARDDAETLEKAATLVPVGEAGDGLPAAESHPSDKATSGKGGTSDRSGDTEEPTDSADGAVAGSAKAVAADAASETERPEDEAPFIALGDIPEFDDEPEEELPSVAFVSSRTAEDPLPGSETPQRLLSPAARFRPLGDVGPGDDEDGMSETGGGEALPQVTLGSVVDIDPEHDHPDAPSAPAGAVRTPRPVRAPVPEAVHGTAAQRRQRHEADQVGRGPLGGAIRGVMPQAAGIDARAGRMRLAIVGAIVFLLVALAVLAWVVGLTSDGESSAVVAPETATITAGPGPGDAEPQDTIQTDTAQAPDAAAAPVLPADPEADQTALATEENTEPEPDLPAGDGTDAAVAEALGVAGSLADPPGGLPADPSNMPAVEQSAAVAGLPPVIVPTPSSSSTDPVAEETMPEPDAAGAPALVVVPATWSTGAGQSALASPSADPGDVAPAPPPAPPPFGTVYTYGANGLILPTPEGVILPGRVTLYAGRPPVVPKPRPGSALPAAPEPAPDPAPNPDDASLGTPAVDGTTGLAADSSANEVPPPVDPAHAALKPKARPASVLALAERMRAEAEKAAAAAAAAAEAMAKASSLAVVSSRRPAARPDDMARSVAAAVAAAAPAEQPAETSVSVAPSAEVDEPEPVSAMPNIPTTVTVSRQATVKNALRLGDTNLIGVFGSSSSRRALIRMSNGRMIKLKVGDTFDGGKVAAIGDSTLSYVKNGKTYTLNIQ
jgi:hypothetical protein